MTDIDQLKDLELIAAFARAIGFSAIIHPIPSELQINKKPFVECWNEAGRFIWFELPADLIIAEFDRIKPIIGDWLVNEKGEKILELIDEKTREYGSGHDFKTAMARLSVKLEEEKAK